jgi:ABC-2 type transport system permease protein
MKSLIKIEWLKIKKYPVFWWMIGIVAITYPAVNTMAYFIYTEITSSKNGDNEANFAKAMFKMLLGEPFAFPTAWHSIAYFSSFFIYIPAMLVIMLINNEYTYKTNRQNIIDGLTRKEFVLSKLIDVVIISITITTIYVITTVFFGLITDYKLVDKIFSEIQYIPLFLLQTFAQLSIAFMCGFFIKKSFLAIGVFVLYGLIVENAIIYPSLMRYDLSIAKYLPLEISDRLIPPIPFFTNLTKDGVDVYKQTMSEIPLHAFLTIALTSGVWYLCFYNYKKRDL